MSATSFFYFERKLNMRIPFKYVKQYEGFFLLIVDHFAILG